MSAVLRLFVVLALVTGCAQRTEFRVIDHPGSGNEERVFIGTTRKLTETGDFSAERSQDLHYLALDVSVPPDRSAGDKAQSAKKRLDPRTEFFFNGRTDYAGREGFRNALRREIASRPKDRRYAVIFVHGYNTTFADGVFRLSQMAEDFGLNGVMLHYAWPSRASPLGYEYDRDSTLIARDGLENLILDARASGATEVVLLAHSMGAQLSMEAMRQMEIARPGAVRRNIDAVALISPDIDVEVFRSQALRAGPLPEVFVIFVSQRDRALGLSAFLSGRQQRLGNINETSDLADLNVTLIDVSEYSQGLGHFTLASSPALIALFSRAGEMEAAFRGAANRNTGLLSGLIISLRGVTQMVLTPLAEAVD